MKIQPGQLAVITGAGSGLGREFALLGARRGLRLVLADVEAAALGETADACRAAGAQVVVQQHTDVASDGEVARLADQAVELGPVNLLFNNAGVGGGGFVWESSEADWRWVLGVNLMGVVHGIRHFVPRMLGAEKGGTPAHVVNTASVAGWLCPPLMGVYNVTKHAVVALSETLFHDLAAARSGIGVTCLCPAYVPTAIAQSHRNRPVELSDGQAPTASMRAAQAAIEKAVAAGRVTAAEVARSTFDAIERPSFYLFTHPQVLPALQARFNNVVSGAAPADPFGDKPGARPTAPPA